MHLLRLSQFAEPAFWTVVRGVAFLGLILNSYGYICNKFLGHSVMLICIAILLPWCQL